MGVYCHRCGTEERKSHLAALLQAFTLYSNVCCSIIFHIFSLERILLASFEDVSFVSEPSQAY